MIDKTPIVSFENYCKGLYHSGCFPFDGGFRMIVECYGNYMQIVENLYLRIYYDRFKHIRG